MKNFWLLFSFFLLTLSVYPCSENDSCENNIKKETTTKDKHHKDSQKTEHCTPFCTCSHCPSSIFYYFKSNIILKKKTFSFQENKLLSFYSFTYNKKIANSIWQPPKIS